MRDTIPWATRYLMALESSDIHGEGYEYCPESVGVIQHAPSCMRSKALVMNWLRSFAQNHVIRKKRLRAD